MFIPTENHLVPDSVDGTTFFNSSRSSVTIPSFSVDELSFADPHENFFLSGGVHRRERRKKNPPYLIPPSSMPSDDQVPRRAHDTGVMDSDVFFFAQQEKTPHIPESLSGHANIGNPFTPHLNHQIGQTTRFGELGTIAQPFTTNPNGEKTYADFEDLSVTDIGWIHKIATFGVRSEDPINIDSTCAASTSVHCSKKMVERETRREESANNLNKANIQILRAATFLRFVCRIPHSCLHLLHVLLQWIVHRISISETFQHMASFTILSKLLRCSPITCLRLQLNRWCRLLQCIARRSKHPSQRPKPLIKSERPTRPMLWIKATLQLSGLSRRFPFADHWDILCNYLFAGDRLLHMTKNVFTLRPWSTMSYICMSSFGSLKSTLFLWNDWPLVAVFPAAQSVYVLQSVSKGEERTDSTLDSHCVSATSDRKKATTVLACANYG